MNYSLPPKIVTGKKSRTSVCLDAAQFREFRGEVAKLGYSASDAIDYLISEFLKRLKKDPK